MDLKEYLGGNLEDAHRMLAIALQDLTDAVVHWQPPGTANTIAQILAHMVMGEDRLINRSIKGGERLFEAEGWAAKTGIPAGEGRIWDQKDWRLDLAGFAEYQKAVETAATVWLDAARPADIDREVTFGPFTRSVAAQLRGVVVHHILGHAGEISALKGVQGLKGLPF